MAIAEGLIDFTTIDINIHTTQRLVDREVRTVIYRTSKNENPCPGAN